MNSGPGIGPRIADGDVVSSFIRERRFDRMRSTNDVLQSKSVER